MSMLFVRYTDPPTHIVGTEEKIHRAIVDEGRNPVGEFEYAKLNEDDKERTPVRIVRPKRVILTPDQVREMRPPGAIDLALVNACSPGDVVAMTAVVRELHGAFPGRYRTAVQTWFPELWQGNPHITSELEIVQPRRIDWDWRGTPSIEANRHFVRCWRDDLAAKLGITLPLSSICGDIHLTDKEKEWPADLLGEGPRPFAIINSTVKNRGAIKGWGQEKYQAVVDQLTGKIEFVQVGQSDFVRGALSGATNLLYQTEIRDLCRLVYWSSLVVCPITFLAHLSAAIPLQKGGIRPCVVIAGGREEQSTIAYEGHRVISSVGSLSCCSKGACWKMHMPDESSHDKMQCEKPLQKLSGEWVGQCFDEIKPIRVIDAIESYNLF